MATQNMMVPGVAPQDDPHYNIPVEYIGNPIEPNFFCRAWNPKRNKYCRARAGQGTDHSGEGRCRVHSGNAPITHGKFSNVVRGELRDLLDHFEDQDDDEKLDLTSHGNLATAVAVNYANKYEAFVDALIAWNKKEAQDALLDERKPKFMNIPKLEDVVGALEKAANIIDKEKKQRQAGSIPAKEFNRVIKQMAKSVSDRIREFEESNKIAVNDAEELLDKVREDWREIRTRKRD